MKGVISVLLISGVLTSHAVLAACPTTLPEQFYSDCMIAEGSGETFPNADYVYLEQYMAWKDQSERVEIDTRLQISKDDIR